jgi:hypothetical protein
MLSLKKSVKIVKETEDYIKCNLNFAFQLQQPPIQQKVMEMKANNEEKKIAFDNHELI